jgi:hypothetical protein
MVTPADDNQMTLDALTVLRYAERPSQIHEELSWSEPFRMSESTREIFVRALLHHMQHCGVEVTAQDGYIVHRLVDAFDAGRTEAIDAFQRITREAFARTPGPAVIVPGP